MSQQFTLPSGTVISIDQVTEIGHIRNLSRGADPFMLGLSVLGFSIRLRSGDKLYVDASYHYSDWPKAKKQVEAVRKELIALCPNATVHNS